MSMIKYEDAKQYFEVGAIKKAVVVEDPMKEGWNYLLIVTGKRGE